MYFTLEHSSVQTSHFRVLGRHMWPVAAVWAAQGWKVRGQALRPDCLSRSLALPLTSCGVVAEFLNLFLPEFSSSIEWD